MPSSSSFSSNICNWKETALIAALAAGFGTMVALQVVMSITSITTTFATTNSSRRKRDPYYYDDVDEEEEKESEAARRRRRLSNTSTTNTTTTTNTSNSNNHDKDLSVPATGWSMAEALASAEQESAKTASMTPREVLQSLQRGNMRFYSGLAHRPEQSAFQRRALISHQFPSTAVLGCSDSRVPVEIVFDQGLGDMFVVRVAGNCLGVTTEASLEYAVLHLHVKVLMVMGHEGCGAIRAAVGLTEQQFNQQEPPALASLLNQLKTGLKSTNVHHILDARARDREAVAANVAKQVVALAEVPQILERIEQGKLKIVGAFYEISSGIVDFFYLVSQIVPGEDFKPSPGVQSRYHPRTKELVYAS